jgi:hypothetical protein
LAMREFRYPAVRVRQTQSGGWVLLFGAPATEIDMWAGVPQKKQFKTETGTNETVGFQRDINPKRLESLKTFYGSEANIIQNPLLCAARKTKLGTVSFAGGEGAAGADAAQIGVVTISLDTLEDRELLQLLQDAKEQLEERVPALRAETVPGDLLARLKREAEPPDDEDGQGEQEDERVEGRDDEAEGPESAAAAFSEESHILDSWREITARVQLLAELGPGGHAGNIFHGYSKDVLISLLRPVVVVDGQHRLRGALETAKKLASEDPFRVEIEKRVLAGEPADKVQREVERDASRTLPVSLLLSDDPAEHVFQFVVVNQKATPIDRALLGTIVSTSLSNDELERVAKRLQASDIPLLEARSVAYLTRNPSSPFYDLVEKGFTSESRDVLPWTVLVSLVRIFRELKNGRLFHDSNDYADRWRRRCLEGSGIVARWEEGGAEGQLAYWKRPDGPWREFFVAFWSAVRDELGNTTDEEAHNYWGRPRSSNLFNKVSLSILAADFFQWLGDREQVVKGQDQVRELVKNWLGDVDRNYFNRNWNLVGSGVKKDSPGIRRNWSRLWVEYRKDPVRLPRVENYRKVAAE